MITSINIQSNESGIMVFAEFVFNILKFFNKWLGLIGLFIVAVVIFPFVVWAIIHSSFELKATAKDISKKRKTLLDEIPAYSFDQIKKTEELVSTESEKFAGFNKSLQLIPGRILFKRIYLAVSSINSDYEAINQALQNRYAYSSDELSTEQLDAVTNYWAKVRKNKPDVYKILNLDKSGEEIIFNAKTTQ
ncbi:MAG: hypothetical protein V4511_03050 [Bacteroidota bacterium]